jgi:hypothetical protein
MKVLEMRKLPRYGAKLPVRRIVGVDLIPQSPTHRRDTVELRLECGHRSAYVVLNANSAAGTTGRLAQTKELVGSTLGCAKCLAVREIQSKVRSRARGTSAA